VRPRWINTNAAVYFYPMRVFRYILVISLNFFAFHAISQEAIGLKAKYAWEDLTKGFEVPADYEGPSFKPILSKDFFHEVEIPWENLGPNKQPTEMNPGGQAIPTYSIERGNGTGRINFILVNPTEEDNVFACSPTGGLFVTWDGGETWDCAGTDQLPISGVSSVTINPFDSHHWVIATGDCDDRFMFSDGIWRTYDAGKTWENINGHRASATFPVSEEIKNWTFVGKILAHPCDFGRLFAATNRGLFMTHNSMDDAEKVEWIKVADGQFYDLEIVPWAESVVFAGGDQFYWSRNCGDDWEKLRMPEWGNPEKFKFPRLSMELCEKDPDNLFVAVTSAEKHGQSAIGEAMFQKFDYRKRKWSEVRSLKKSMNNVIPTRARAFAVDPLDSSIVLAGNVQPVYRSEDGGYKFNRIEKGQMHDDIHHLEFSPSGKTVWAAHDGGVSVSYDKGVTWKPRDHGIGAANVFGISVAQMKGDQVVYGGYDTGGNLLKDSAWYHVTWGDGFQTIIDHSDPDVMFATKQNGYINRTMDGGLDWDKSVSSSLGKTSWHTWIRMNTEYSNVVYCSGDKLVRSTSQGEEWEVILDVGSIYDDLKSTYRMYLSETNPDVMYAYCLSKGEGQPVLMRTLNLNEDKPDRIDWERIDTPTSGWLAGMAIDPDDPEKFWMAYISYKADKKVWRYSGEGRWSDIGKKLGFAVPEELIVDPEGGERLYLGTNYGVFTRNKTENDWTLLSGLPGCYVKSLAINRENGMIYAGTYGRGVWKAPLYFPVEAED